ncbi:hypothetical protein BRX37_23940 [Sphingomonas sp. S-NIH.Pt3_0716]|nr:hypothetical protein BRX37_23940 [Sphingomonas sp. S-NIH.Pt3_0716]
MIKGEGKFAVAIVSVVIVAVVGAAFAFPRYPELPTHDWLYERDESYYPGAAKCTPSRLSKLPELDAADEKYRCDMALEREKYQEIIQAMRSADASVASVELSYRQTLIAIIGAVFGIVTLIAAASAAWYARMGAIAARATQDSYIEVERANPVIDLDNFRYETTIIRFDVVATNVGGTSCVAALFGSAWIAQKDESSGLLTGHSKVIPIGAGEKKIIETVSVQRENLKRERFYEGGISFISSLGGNERRKFKFEVFGSRASPHNTTHVDIINQARFIANA